MKGLDVKRYRIGVAPAFGVQQVTMVPDDDGDMVRHSDIAPLLIELEALRARNLELERIMTDILRAIDGAGEE